jgi:hypothetical protein
LKTFLPDVNVWLALASPPDIFRIKPEFWNRCECESGVE